MTEDMIEASGYSIAPSLATPNGTGGGRYNGTLLALCNTSLTLRSGERKEASRAQDPTRQHEATVVVNSVCLGAVSFEPVLLVPHDDYVGILQAKVDRVSSFLGLLSPAEKALGDAGDPRQDGMCLLLAAAHANQEIRFPWSRHL